MTYCLNPRCSKPLNPDGTVFCHSCGTKLIPLLKNRYRIIRPLGSGGFGKTFLAEDEDKLKEHCVVKQLAPKVLGTSALLKSMQLFEDEARQLQQLGKNHPQIPTLHAYFNQDNCLYLVQEFIEGKTLTQELNEQGCFSEEKIWNLLKELLPVLKFIHDNQVIHRDIKPDNIIRRDSDGRLVLIDFGASKLVTNIKGQQGTQIGTHGYSPLEQIKCGEAYPASDLFSLGVTCFHLLTGINPFDLYINSGYSWVTNWNKYCKVKISQKLYQVVNKLLETDIQNRYQSADEVLQLPQISQSVTQPPKSWFNFQLPLAPALLVNKKWLIYVLLSVLVLTGYVISHNLPDNPTLIGHSDEVNSLAFSSDGITLASGSDDKTIKIWNLNNKKEIRTFKGHSNFVYSVAISPDGQILVSGSKDKTIKIWSLKTGQLINTLNGHKDFVDSVAISPDGQTIASGSYDHTIKLWNLKTLQLIRTFEGHSAQVLSVAISPDNQILISGSKDKTIKMWNLNTGQEIRTIQAHSGDVNAIAISSRGDMFASASDDKTVKVWDLNTGHEIRTIGIHSADVNAIAFSHDGDKIASGSDDKTVKIWNLMSGELLDTLEVHKSAVYAVAFSPNDKTLVSAGADKTIRIWHVR
ncbi:protein kinase [Tolypothrix sp. NIES-4075]|uniref:serine/threonine-protein kinase n=1 Tax=Tolypothrix sp. NIES-4075 TaxID=2005459 RepID=UPI000B5C91BC|nr:serine/threonine-protein kinase [Tolypothrix sp. NIES-4075]GAX41443.1 protein kinase [Tolypothrix sp. NIES-4075]